MIIGYLILGFLGAALSSLAALMAGYGILAAIGFYVLGGSLTTMIAICANLGCRMVHQPKFATIKT